MLGAGCIATLFRGPREDNDEEQLHAKVGALLLFEGLWHLRGVHGKDLEMKLIKGPARG